MSFPVVKLTLKITICSDKARIERLLTKKAWFMKKIASHDKTENKSQDKLKKDENKAQEASTDQLLKVNKPLFFI